MINGILFLLILPSILADLSAHRWLPLPSDNTGTLLLDRVSVRAVRRQKLWVRVIWHNPKDGVVYSDWLENFDCYTSSSFPSRIIGYAADGKTISDMRNDEGDFMSILTDESSPVVRGEACNAFDAGGAEDERKRPFDAKSRLLPFSHIGTSFKALMPVEKLTSFKARSLFDRTEPVFKCLAA